MSIDWGGADCPDLPLALAPNILLIGPPGSGKTMLSRRLPTILPPMTMTEALETTQIYSASGRLPAGKALMAVRPVRSPHHTASGPAMVGGGTVPQAGEVSLAHHGVLFLDEFPEFMRSILETLRQPLEEGYVTISRAHASVRFPASFMLVAAMNPCPCGYFSDPHRHCKCDPRQIDRKDDPASSDLGNGNAPLVDMGPYEFQPCPDCPLDGNGDGVINIEDLLLVIAEWGPCPQSCEQSAGCPCFMDFNQTCTVDIEELLEVIALWNLPCP